MDAYELPLVIFTVLSQWAVGITIAVSLLEWIKPKFMEGVGKEALKTPIFIALGVSILSGLSSMTHINNPFKAVNTLLGVGHSWLSREIVAVILFNLALILLAYIWWKKVDQSSLRKGIGTLTAILGVALIFSSAAIYFSNELHPAWNNWTTFANFLLTGLLLGALTVTYFIIKGKEEEDRSSVVKLLGTYLGLVVVALFVTIGASAMISNGSATSAISATTTFTSVLFWIRILASLLIPATLVVSLIASKKKVLSMNHVLTATALVLVGELAGRMIFYYSVMSQYPWI